MAKAAIGLQFNLWDYAAGTPAYAQIGEVKDVSGIGVEKEMIDTTHQGSTDGVREFLAGLVTEKPFSVTVQLDYDLANSSNAKNHDLLRSQAVSRTATKAKIVFVSGGPNVIWDTCHVSDLTIDAPLGGPVMGTFTITPSGPATWAST